MNFIEEKKKQTSDGPISHISFHFFAFNFTVILVDI